MPPTNMSIQPGSVDSMGHIRPPMNQEDHPEHNMPESEHDGTPLSLVSQGNSDLLNRALGPKNVKQNVRDGYTGQGYRYGMDAR